MKHSVATQLASALGRRDEGPNLLLAERIANSMDEGAVEELVELLLKAKRPIQHDAIKVLYEVGERKPALLVPYIRNFIDLLTHQSNRLQWGAMTALDYVTPEQPKMIFAALPTILSAADSGSVITRDHAMHILIRLAAMRTYAGRVFPLLLEQLSLAPVNQLPMYAERALPIISTATAEAFSETLRARLDDMTKDSGRRRLEAVIRRTYRT